MTIKVQRILYHRKLGVVNDCDVLRQPSSEESWLLCGIALCAIVLTLEADQNFQFLQIFALSFLRHHSTLF